MCESSILIFNIRSAIFRILLNKFTLDYICVDDCALKSVQSAYMYILAREKVVESDHAAIGADVEGS